MFIKLSDVTDQKVQMLRMNGFRLVGGMQGGELGVFVRKHSK